MVIPSIDLMDGKAVQLVQGKKKAVEAENVLELAKKFGRIGEIAVIDLDAAMGNGKDNLGLVKALCKIARCRVGGGIRTVEKGEELLRAGAEKIIIGTKTTPEFLQNFPKDCVIVAADSKKGMVVSNGWKKRTGKTPASLIKELEDYCCGFLYTQVDSEGLLQGINIENIKEVKKLTKNRLTAAGGISSFEEIQVLEELGVDSQIGMALYTGKINLEELYISLLDFEKMNGVMPTIVKDTNGQVLMLAYSTKESLRLALETGNGTYFSRSRNGIWRKGATSGNTQELVQVNYDCDKDALLFTVKQKNNACHKGGYSCFGDKGFALGGLYSVLRGRVERPKKGSYTSKLAKDPMSIKRKIMEEAYEVVTAESKDELIWELADLTYFSLVLMAKQGILPCEIKNELRRRRK